MTNQEKQPGGQAKFEVTLTVSGWYVLAGLVFLGALGTRLAGLERLGQSLMFLACLLVIAGALTSLIGAGQRKRNNP
jgi:hypothetical protein